MIAKTGMLPECYSLLNTRTFPLTGNYWSQERLSLLPVDGSQVDSWKIEVGCSLCSSQLFFPYFLMKPWHHQSISLLLWILQHHGSQNNHWTLTRKAIFLRLASNFFLAKLLNWQARNQVPSKPVLSRVVCAFVRFVRMNLEWLCWPLTDWPFKWKSTTGMHNQIYINSRMWLIREISMVAKELTWKFSQ